MNSIAKLFGFTSCATALMAGSALAQSCLVTGVPVVNARTALLGSTVTAYMAAGTAQLIALHEYQTEMLISALKTGVAQTASSNDQIATTVVKSNEATASAYVSSDQAMQIMEESDRYQSLGYDSCGVQSTMGTFHTAYKKTFSDGPAYTGNVKAKPGVIADPKGYYDDILNGTNLSAQALFNGDTSAAAEYMNAVMGPPDTILKTQGQSPSGSIFLQEKLNRDSRKSVALWAMDQIAKENAPDGAKAALDGVINGYIGDDGGEKWAASMAGSHERGILLDAVRIEAANLASLAYEIRQQQRTEMVTATYALSRAEKLIGANGKSRPPVMIPGAQQASR